MTVAPVELNQNPPSPELDCQSLEELLSQAREQWARRMEGLEREADAFEAEQRTRSIDAWRRVYDAAREIVPATLWEYLEHIDVDEDGNWTFPGNVANPLFLKIPGLAPIRLLFDRITGSEPPQYRLNTDGDGNWLTVAGARKSVEYETVEEAVVYSFRWGPSPCDELSIALALAEKEHQHYQASQEEAAKELFSRELMAITQPSPSTLPEPDLPARRTGVHEQLVACRQALYAASQAHADRKRDLELAEAAAWRDGRVQGSNDRERKTWLRENLSENAVLEQAEREKDAAQLAYDLARFEVDLVEDLIRLHGEG